LGQKKEEVATKVVGVSRVEVGKEVDMDGSGAGKKGEKASKGDGTCERERRI